MTERRQLWLRPLSKGHLPTIAAWHGRLEDLSLFDRRTPLPPSGDAFEAAWRICIDALPPRTDEWFVVEDTGGDCLALSGLQEINGVHGDAVMAVFVAEPARRQGIAVRSLALLLDMAFDQLRLHRVTSFHRADNQPSRLMIRSLGFREEGCLRQSWYSGGSYHDIVVIGMLCAEWREFRQGLRERLSMDTVVTLGNGRGKGWSWPAAPGHYDEDSRVG